MLKGLSQESALRNLSSWFRTYVLKDRLQSSPDPKAPLDERPFREEVIRLSARFDHPETAEALLRRFDSFSDKEKAAAVSTMTRRVSLAVSLLDAIVAGRVDKKRLTAFHARQLGNLKSRSVDDKLAKVWGKVTVTPEAQQKQIAELERRVGEAPLWAFDAGEGRKHFVLLCSPCHQLDGEGVDIGPSLAGSGSNGALYFIENIIDPHAVIGTDYQASLIETKDGEFVSGLIEKETATAVTIRTVLGSVTVPRTNIETLSLGKQSMMPSGLLDGLNERQQIELLKFLRSL